MRKNGVRRKVLVIGLDGATFDTINPFLENGYLPNLQKLIEQGASGPLRSSVPPITAPAWLALATGLRPEKTGVYDFLLWEKDRETLRSVNSTYFFGRSIWDFLGKQGKLIGVFNYPLLRPPYAVNGFMVSGLGAVYAEEFTFPASLKEEFHNLLEGEYQILIDREASHYEHNIELFFKDIYKLFEKQLKITQYLITEKECDLLWVVFQQTDWVQHIVWHHIDQSHPLNDGEESKKWADLYRQFWVWIDGMIGNLCETVGDETNIFILSDHGFGPSSSSFKLNFWLEKEGYLCRKNRSTVKKMKAAIYRFLQNTAVKLGKTKLIPSVVYKLGRKTVDNFRVDVLNDIDLNRSLAFDPGHTNNFGGIYINRQVIKTSYETEQIVNEIRTKLMEWGKLNGLAVQIWLPESRIVGNPRVNIPDIVLGIDDWGCELDKYSFEGSLLEKKTRSHRNTGSHRNDGIFIGYGPDVKHTAVRAEIYDIAPTLLYLFDETVPSSMDGRVLEEIFTDSYLNNHPPRIGTFKLDNFETNAAIVETDEEEMIKQLQNLGYI
jgi:predicted AlkP superfamily phosphohydrolase/phosphomutase